MDLSRRCKLYLRLQPRPNQSVANQDQPFAQRHAHPVRKFDRRRTCAAFCAIDDDVIEHDAGFSHRLDHGKDFVRLADTQFHADRLATGKIAQFCGPLQHADRCRKGRMRRGRDAIRAHGHAACFGDFFRYLGAGQYTAVTRLRALADLDFDHLDLVVARIVGKPVRVERSVVLAASEIAAADFPDEVPAMRTVIARNAAFARVVVEIARRCALVQGHDRVGRQRSETHCRDVQQRRGVGFVTLAAAHIDPPFRGYIGIRCHRMGKPLVFVRIYVQFRAERVAVELALRSRIDQRTLLVVEGPPFEVTLYQIGPRIGAQVFHHPAHMGEQRIIPPQGMAALTEVIHRHDQ